MPRMIRIIKAIRKINKSNHNFKKKTSPEASAARHFRGCFLLLLFILDIKSVKYHIISVIAIVE